METTGAQALRTALVTGASRGIGRSIALRLARAGCAIAVNYRRSADSAADVVSAIEAVGCRAVSLQADVADPGQARDLVARAEEALGSIDIVVSNAGITRDRLLIQTSEEDWNATWNTDLLGPRALCRAALPTMSRRRTGRIITISSVVATTGNAGQANYAAAKAALEGLTREMAVAVGQAGVTVNCVIPGYIPTDATRELTQIQRDAWMGRIPMGRGGIPEDIAELVGFLCGPGAGYITGQCIAVDGGLLARSGAGLAS